MSSYSSTIFEIFPAPCAKVCVSETLYYYLFCQNKVELQVFTKDPSEKQMYFVKARNQKVYKHFYSVVIECNITVCKFHCSRDNIQVSDGHRRPHSLNVNNCNAPNPFFLLAAGKHYRMTASYIHVFLCLSIAPTCLLRHNFFSVTYHS